MVRETVVEVLVHLGIEEADLRDDARLHGDLGLDSTETVELELELLRRLGADVKLDRDADPTVADVCALVERERAAAPVVD